MVNEHYRTNISASFYFHAASDLPRKKTTVVVFSFLFLLVAFISIFFFLNHCDKNDKIQKWDNLKIKAIFGVLLPFLFLILSDWCFFDLSFSFPSVLFLLLLLFLKRKKRAFVRSFILLLFLFLHDNFFDFVPR